jgi:WD40 repeat protein
VTISGQFPHSLTSPSPARQGAIFTVAFSPLSPDLLASGSDDRTLRIWDLSPLSTSSDSTNSNVATQEKLVEEQARVLWGHEGRVWRIEWVDKNRLVSVAEVSHGSATISPILNLQTTVADGPSESRMPLVDSGSSTRLTRRFRPRTGKVERTIQATASFKRGGMVTTVERYGVSTLRNSTLERRMSDWSRSQEELMERLGAGPYHRLLNRSRQKLHLYRRRSSTKDLRSNLSSSR